MAAKVPVAFTNTSAGGLFSNVQWTFTGATPPSSTNENPTNICYPAAGTYPVSLTVTNTNGSNTSTQNSFVTITNPIPVANFSYNQIDNYTTEFSSTGIGATTYLWLFSGNVTGTGATSSFDFPAEGTYPVTLIAYGPCGSDTVTIDVVILKIATAINEVAELKGFTLFPNPGSDIINIKLADANNNIAIDIIDPLGKVVASYAKLSGQTLQLDCSTIAPGAYLMRISVNGKQGKKVWVKL